MVKCKICNTSVPILFDGRCTGCMSVESIEVGQAEVDFIYALLETPLKDGELVQIFRDNQISLGSGNNSNVPNQEKEDRVNIIIRGINKVNPDASLFIKPITALYNKYRDNIESGEYKIDLLMNYGVTVGGQVVETKAGVVVYKEIEYYDEDEVDDDIDYDDDEE
mgnify:CR=1 FL=1